MNSYHVAKKVVKYLDERFAETIKDRDGDSPTAFGKIATREMGLGGGDGSSVIWEGCYEWTTPKEFERMSRVVEGTGFSLFPTAEWMVEII